MEFFDKIEKCRKSRDSVSLTSYVLCGEQDIIKTAMQRKQSSNTKSVTDRTQIAKAVFIRDTYFEIRTDLG